VCGATIGAPAQRFVPIHHFKGPSDGSEPSIYESLTIDKAGNLYGTTFYGGGHTDCYPIGCGIVFKIDPAGSETVLHSFSGRDGQFAWGGVILDERGNLYGTTLAGIFKINRSGKETVLHRFNVERDGGRMGYFPVGNLLRDSAGNLYGTTMDGGDMSCVIQRQLDGCGTIFKLSKGGTFTVLHRFHDSDGAFPQGSLISDPQGNVYGTSIGGGKNLGTVFKVDTTGKFSVIHHFTHLGDGAFPNAPLTIDAAGVLYGTTDGGGTWGMGTVFKINAAGRETILHSFSGGTDGWRPVGGLAADPAGNFYGTTLYGGNPNCKNGGTDGCGTIYKLDINGRETVLYAFRSAGRAFPSSGLVMDASGILYGVLSTNNGVIYKFIP
jgi:uncharacterized repeat protein (TIGR03803 family)